ncbi:fumarylacetoacetate hydrolase family protein [Oricola indica]|uniref:fumarylacetoacetate hydrolase family protein n=1 Tax=Oricola indica TaxID=2872591 RepID=UPI003CCBD720
MKIARFDGGRIGIVTEAGITDVTDLAGVESGEWPPVGPLRMIAEFDRLRGPLEAAVASRPAKSLDEVRLETPVPWPNKLIAYPVNYHDHAREMTSTGLANIQGFFLKANSSIIGPADAIETPNIDGREFHHECEIGLVIGKECRGIPVEEAMDHVFGFACLMDITVRGKEERVMRKSYDTFTPIGPWIVTRDEIADPSDIEMRLWVNDELRQHANSRDLIVDMPNMVAIAASAMTLYPGDIIATGTPAGVGPINPGDTVTIDVAGVGRMSLPVIAGRYGANVVFDKPYEFKRGA